MIKSLLNIALVGIVLFQSTSLLLAQLGDSTILIQPTGVYAEIDMKKDLLILEQLSEKGTMLSSMDVVLKNPDEYSPTVLCVVSNILFAQGYKDSAAFWFYTGRMRARIDANLCTDNTARSAVSELTQYFGPAINQYMYSDLANLDNVRAVWAKTVAYLETHDELYDRRWIALHGMRAMMSGMEDEEGLEGENDDYESEPIILPEEEWARVKKETIEEQLAALEEALNSLEQENQGSKKKKKKN